MRVAGAATRRGRAVGTVLRPDPGRPLTVQLPPPFLAGGALGPIAVGEEIDVAPAIFVARATATAPCAGGWEVDDLGIVDACGTVLRPTSPGADDPDLAPSVLDTGGRLFPLFWSAPPLAGPAVLGGALYLDPDLAAGTEDGEVVALCRERYRVTSVRRSPRRTWQPVPAVELPAVPAPGEVPDDVVLVADLVPLASPDTEVLTGR